MTFKYMIYNNSEGIDKVIKQIKRPRKTFGSIKEIYEELVNNYLNAFSIDDLYLRYYGYDDRIEKDVYVITTSRLGKDDYIKKYGCPQFVCYMIQL